MAKNRKYHHRRFRNYNIPLELPSRSRPTRNAIRLKLVEHAKSVNQLSTDFKKGDFYISLQKLKESIIFNNIPTASLSKVTAEVTKSTERIQNEEKEQDDYDDDDDEMKNLTISVDDHEASSSYIPTASSSKVTAEVTKTTERIQNDDNDDDEWHDDDNDDDEVLRKNRQNKRRFALALSLTPLSKVTKTTEIIQNEEKEHDDDGDGGGDGDDDDDNDDDNDEMKNLTISVDNHEASSSYIPTTSLSKVTAEVTKITERIQNDDDDDNDHHHASASSSSYDDGDDDDGGDGDDDDGSSGDDNDDDEMKNIINSVDNHQTSGSNIPTLLTERIQNRRSKRRFALPPVYKEDNTRLWTLKYKSSECAPGLVELMPDTGVYINAVKFRMCKTLANDRRSLVRMLLTETFSMIGLCTVYSFNDTRCEPGLDENARTVLLTFVEKYGNRKRWIKVNTKDILKCIKDKMTELKSKKHTLLK